MKRLLLVLIFAALASPAFAKPNLLLITVDDMSCDSIGAFGCALEGTTPNIDAFAAQSRKFLRAHVQVGNCYPSRNVMWSGRYPHNSGVEGFYQVKPIDYPVMSDLMKAAGYYTAIRGKVSHSTPYQPYPAWDADTTILPDGSQAHIKDVESYYTSTKAAIDGAKEAGKPFCFNINISDPHKPFWHPDDPHPTSRIFTADEVPVPGFLPDDPAIREELGLYYSSVRRADDCFGQVMRALNESGLAEDTFILFLSDHGMPLPFAKTQLYHHSTHTPLMVKWPGVTEAGSVDETHLVSAVDFLPTLLDVIGAEHPDGLDGRSFLPLIKGEVQDDREVVFKEYNENAGGFRNPMRGVQTAKFLYLFNPWSNGERVMATATNGTATWKTMKKLANEDSAIAERVDLMEHRVVEEFYDVENDPDCRRNLIDEPAYAEELAKHRKLLKEWMVKTGDHMLSAFEGRQDPAALAAYMEKVEAEAQARKSAKRGGGKKDGKKQANLIRIRLPETIEAGKTVTLKVPHQFPEELGEQVVQVTLKAGPDQKRVAREILKASGKGVLEVNFDVPAEVPGNVISFAAFVGKDYDENLQHLQTKSVPVK
ncbi:MAG: sulfatase [Verrucomicrobiae bacterium]|nr:sulfatase [Verrucomicrobiae bacterium]